MAGNATMRAVMLAGAYNITVQDIPKPTIQNSTDAVVRVSHAAIDGSDLHFYRGTGAAGEYPYNIGHEAMGWVDSKGDGVNLFHQGDWVVIPDNLQVSGVAGEDTESGPIGLGASFGGGLGGLGGCQAEYVRVPFADANLIPIPPPSNSSNGTQNVDYLFVSDIFATGWASLTFSGFEAGDSVAVFGAGPVGLLAAHSAIIRGASQVFSVDYVPDRLEHARSIGAIPINFNESDPVEQIMAYEPNGVRRTVDCVGYEAYNYNLTLSDSIILHDMIRVLAPGGGIGQIGVQYGVGHNTSAAPRGALYDGIVSFPMTDFWSKALSYSAGIVNPRFFERELVTLIEQGIAHPDFIVSKTIGIEEAPQYYRRFDRHEETKVVIEFP